jgi:hypothetical protein
MKILSLLVCMMAISAGHAQSRFVLKAGTGISNFASRTIDGSGGSGPEFDFSVTGYAGAALQIPITQKFNFQPGLTFMERGASLGKIERNSIFYADVPLAMRYRATERFGLEIAPVLSYRLFGSTNSPLFGKRTNSTSAFEPFAYGLSGGIAISLSEIFSITANWYRGLNKAFSFYGRDENNRPTGEIRYYNYSFTIGVEYRLQAN